MKRSHVLQNISLFVEVAKQKSFSRAALILEMPVSSLSKRISAFEETLGVRLLDRTTRKLTLTSYGEAFYAQATHLVEDAQRAYDEITAEARGPCGLLKIAAPPDAWVLHHLSTVVSEYKNQNSNVRIQVDLNHRPTDLMSDRYDLALALEAPRETSLIVRKLLEFENRIFAAPAYLDDWGYPRRPEDLSDHQVIVPGQKTAWSLSNGEETVAVTVTGPIVSNSPTLTRRLAVAGHGLFAANPIETKRNVADGTLIEVMPDWVLRPTPIYVVTTSRLLPAKARSFIDHMSQRLAVIVKVHRTEGAEAHRSARTL